MKKRILLLLVISGISFAEAEEKYQYRFEVDRQSKMATAAEESRRQVRQDMSFEEMRELKRTLRREGFVLSGPGVTGGGNLVVGEFIYLARRHGASDEWIRAWQQDGNLDVTEAHLMDGEEELNFVADSTGMVILINRSKWQALSKLQKSAVVTEILMRSRD